MKFVLDHNLPPRLARALNELSQAPMAPRLDRIAPASLPP